MRSRLAAARRYTRGIIGYVSWSRRCAHGPLVELPSSRPELTRSLHPGDLRAVVPQVSLRLSLLGAEQPERSNTVTISGIRSRRLCFGCAWQAGGLRPEGGR